MDAHRHRWAVVGFLIEAERPMMRQSCACGLERTIPAWDRTWNPPAPEPQEQSTP